MKIYNVVYRETDTSCVIQADIDSSLTIKPFKAYFKTDKKNKLLVNVSADSFVCAFLLLAMKLEEPLEIDAPISQSLINNLKKIVNLVSSWKTTDIWPKLNKIEIKNTKTSSYINQNSVDIRAAFFSLGLDSFYTLQESEKNEKTRLKYLILVYGFDINLNNNKFFALVKNNSLKVARETKKELIVVETNARELTEKLLIWDAAHGGALASVGHFLSKGIDHIYFNGEDANISKTPYGTHPDLDNLWNSKYLSMSIFKVIKRSQATFALKNNILAQKYLRVCWENKNDLYNCCNCQKCLRTMLQLKTTGNQNKFSTFSTSLPYHLLGHMIEPRHRWFLWRDLLIQLPFPNIGLRILIIKMLFRSYWIYLKK